MIKIYYTIELKSGYSFSCCTTYKNYSLDEDYRPVANGALICNFGLKEDLLEKRYHFSPGGERIFAGSEVVSIYGLQFVPDS